MDLCWHCLEGAGCPPIITERRQLGQGEIRVKRDPNRPCLPFPALRLHCGNMRKRWLQCGVLARPVHGDVRGLGWGPQPLPLERMEWAAWGELQEGGGGPEAPAGVKTIRGTPHSPVPPAPAENEGSSLPLHPRAKSLGHSSSWGCWLGKGGRDRGRAPSRRA